MALRDGPADLESGATSVIETTEQLRIPAIDLVVVDGPDRGKRARVRQGPGRVGTARGCDLCLSDRTVSRMHCAIQVDAAAITLRDRESTNGTFVDGRRVRDIDLSPGTLVAIGATTFRIDLADEPGALELSPHQSFGDLVGKSVAMRGIYAVLEKAAVADSTVLIQGETGTGKEVVARSLHQRSRRAARPFITVDCGALPENLIESELFGHVKGAFTGAQGDRRGALEEADGGTLFFDEIGELPIALQPKLLRALEARQVRRVGSNQHRPIDVRVIAATNRSLAKSVNEGTFREDLYYRLAVIEVELPPLRARREDIPLLAANLLERLTGSAAVVAPELLSTLVSRAWPGNVRELRNFLERSVSLGWSSPRSAAEEALVASPTMPIPSEISALVPLHLPFKEARVAWTDQFENVYVRAQLEKAGGNVTRAAELSGLSRRFLQRTMVRMGMRSAAGDDDEAT